MGKVSLITIVDVVSRLKAESYPSLETTNPALPDYQLSFVNLKEVKSLFECQPKA